MEDPTKKPVNPVNKIKIIIFGLVIFIFAVLPPFLISFFVAKTFSELGINDPLGVISDFITAPESKVNSQDGEIGILILGKSGAGYSAPDLTDTVIFGSLDLNQQKLNLISLPRDIWVPAIRAKLNTAYYWGDQKGAGEGLKLAKSLTSDIVGQPVDYALVLDFSGFKEMIDAMGGIDINVERSFTDKKFPIPGKENDLCNGDKEFKCRYETVSFQKGLTHMDGTLALKFARSRNSEGEEGTDLARAARQEKVILALKEKTLSPQILLSPFKVLSLYKAVMKNLETDLPVSTQAVLARKILEARKSIQSNVLPESFLTNPPISSRYDYQYVFIPKGGSWKEVNNWVKDLLK